jgi:hypothetical protein
MMNEADRNRIKETLLRLSRGAAAEVLGPQAAACSGLAILDAVETFDESSRRYGKILIRLTVVLVVLTVVLVGLTIVLVRHVDAYVLDSVGTFACAAGVCWFLRRGGLGPESSA